MKKRKHWSKSCWFLDGYEGISCNGYRKKSTALKDMIELWNDDADYHKKEYGDVQFTEDNIKKEFGVFCPKCSYFTIGEDFCAECDKRYVQVVMFTLYFESSQPNNLLP